MLASVAKGMGLRGRPKYLQSNQSCQKKGIFLLGFPNNIDGRCSRANQGRVVTVAYLLLVYVDLPRLVRAEEGAA